MCVVIGLFISVTADGAFSVTADGAWAPSGINIDYVASTLWTGVVDSKVVGNYAYCAYWNGLVPMPILRMMQAG
jgi:hypothetical protein